MKKFLIISFLSSILTISIILGIIFRENLSNFVNKSYEEITAVSEPNKIEEYEKWYDSVASDPIARNRLKESDFKLVEDDFSKYLLPVSWKEFKGPEVNRITSADGIFIKNKIIKYSKREKSFKSLDGFDTVYNEVLFDPNTFAGFDIPEDFIKRLESLYLSESYKSKNQKTEFRLNYVLQLETASKYYFEEYDPSNPDFQMGLPREIYIFKSDTNLALYEIQDNSENSTEKKDLNKALKEVFIERYELKW